MTAADRPAGHDAHQQTAAEGYHSDRWRAVVVDEDDFRLACHLVSNWRKTSDGSDPELIDRIAAIVTDTRAAAEQRGRDDEKRKVERWITEAVIALKAATAINERMFRTGEVEGLNLGNHDRLVRESTDLLAALADRSEEAT